MFQTGLIFSENTASNESRCTGQFGLVYGHVNMGFALVSWYRFLTTARGGGGGGARMEGANVAQAKWFHLNKHSCQKNLTLQFHEGNDLFNDARNTFYLRLH